MKPSNSRVINLHFNHQLKIMDFPSYQEAIVHMPKIGICFHNPHGIVMLSNKIKHILPHQGIQISVCTIILPVNIQDHFTSCKSKKWISSTSDNIVLGINFPK